MKYYDVFLEVQDRFLSINAENPKQALKKALKDLLNAIENESIELTKDIDHDRGFISYEYHKYNPHEYETFNVYVHDILDYSHLHGKKYDDYKGYDIFHWENDNINMEKKCDYSFCDCCGIILPKNTMYAFRRPKEPYEGYKEVSLVDKIKEIGLNPEYMDSFVAICEDCFDNQKYMEEYNRIKEIEEESNND